MKVFSDELRFRWEWRSYQQRVLNDLEGHLADNHLHVIAAPGSGKTVLGLEVMLRLNRPTLIMAPTLAIRDQWVDRLLTLFREGGYVMPEWVSKDVRQPKLLTVSTYQGLHSACTGKVEKEAEEENGDLEAEGVEENGGTRKKVNKTGEVVGNLQNAGVQTLVLDEAHHLRNEWWKCLIEVKRGLGEPTVVALTATPPYDVSPLEWGRYKDLCGAVDAEIYVPELVGQENLCPHQDYVYMSMPGRDDREEINEFRSRVKEVVGTLEGNREFAGLLEGHKCVQRPREYIEEILADPGFYSSIVIFLHQVHKRGPRELRQVIGVSGKRVPKLSWDWLEKLLTGCLYTHADEFEGGEAVFTDLRRELKRIGAIERRKVRLGQTAMALP